MAPIATQAQAKNDGNLMRRILVKKDKLIVLCRKISFKTVIGHHKTYQVEDMYKRESFRCRIVSGEKKSPSSFQSKDVLIRIRQRIGSAKRRNRSDIWTPAHGGVEYSVFPKQQEVMPISENSVESINLLESHEKLKESRRSLSFTSKKEKKIENGATKTFIISKKDGDDDSPLDGNLTPIIRAVLDFDGRFDPEHRSSDVDDDEDFDEDSIHRKCGARSKRKYVDVYDLEFRRGSLDESHFYSCNRRSSGNSSFFSHPRKRSLSHFWFD